MYVFVYLLMFRKPMTLLYVKEQAQKIRIGFCFSSLVGSSKENGSSLQKKKKKFEDPDFRLSIADLNTQYFRYRISCFNKHARNAINRDARASTTLYYFDCSTSTSRPQKLYVYNFLTVGRLVFFILFLYFSFSVFLCLCLALLPAILYVALYGSIVFIFSFCRSSLWLCFYLFV